MLTNFLFQIQHGMDHVLSLSAYAHILFLIVLAVPYLFKDWKRIFFLTIIFILGHSVTLALATYHVISVNSNWIAFLIPLTILVIALYNVFTAGKKSLNEKRSMLFFATLFFGLIHGLGFVNTFEATISNSDNKVIALLENALGIEIGQLIVVFIILFIGFLCQTLFRFSKRDWVIVISSIVIGMILPMLIHNKMFA